VLLAVGRPVSPYLALSCYCDGFGTLLFTLFFTERVRGRIHRSLGLGWNGKPETCRSLAAVASLIGSGAATSVIERRCRDAISSFRGVPWTSLTAGDLAAEWDGELEARRQEDHTVPAALGEVDAFLSHSWSDDGREKYEVLCGWADAFEAAYGRPPLLWLDRCCIRQDDDIAASLLGLPIFLSGCRCHTPAQSHTSPRLAPARRLAPTARPSPVAARCSSSTARPTAAGCGARPYCPHWRERRRRACLTFSVPHQGV